MPLLKLGTSGAATKAWQEFLVGRGFLLVGMATGAFDEMTHRATQAFQSNEGLDADGVVGPRTIAKAKGHGFTEPVLQPPSQPGALITDAQLRAVMSNLASEKRITYLPYLNASMGEFEIIGRLRASAYLAQLAHESKELQVWSENLNYSADGLMRTWPTRFNRERATAYQRQPEKIANYVYANRMGNGAEASGDGWKFRGRCPLQTTGKDMYQKCGKALKIDLVADPDLLLLPEYGFRAAAWIWAVEKGLNPLADKRAFRDITKRINGGYNGLAEREEYYERALQILKR